MKVAVLGTGMYGLALACAISYNKHDVYMWSEDEVLVNSFKKNHKLDKIIDIDIPSNIEVSASFKEVLSNSDLIIMAVSAKYVRDVCISIKDIYESSVPICIASKGIENTTCDFLSEVIRKELKAKFIVAISGPTFAIDMINKEPVALSLASTSRKATKLVKEALASDYLKLRNNDDLYGTQICGSVKNVFAIASGILDGLGYNESTQAFLINESLHDIKELLKGLECNPKTINSYAGIGDLILTCSSPKSRNYSFGKLLGSKVGSEKIKEYLDNNTVEGYYTLLSIHELIKRRHIKIPIINIIYDIIVNNKEPEILVEFLIKKD